MQGVARNDLQLISVACMLVAAKHEEVIWARICDTAPDLDAMCCNLATLFQTYAIH